MLNLRLIEVLLGGLAESTHVVFVGDADQLPPIGAGKPFEDLIASGDRAGRPPHPDLPPGGALDDHHRRPRDQPGPPAAPGARRTTRTTTSSSSTAPTPSGRWRPWSRWSPSGRRRASASTRSARCRCWRRCTGGRSGSTRSTSACRSGSTPTASGRSSDRFRVGDRLIQTRNSHELGLMNGSIVFLRADDPDEEEILVDTDEGELADDPLRRDRDPAPRLRDLGPQGAGLRGAGRGRRLPPLPRADADPPPPLHRDHPCPQQLRADRRPRGARRRGPSRRQRAALLRPGRAAARVARGWRLGPVRFCAPQV